MDGLPFGKKKWLESGAHDKRTTVEVHEERQRLYR